MCATLEHSSTNPLTPLTRGFSTHRRTAGLITGLFCIRFNSKLKMKNPENALTIYIGYDPREVTAYDVAKASLVKRASKPLVVQKLKLDQLRKIGVMTRAVETKDGKLWCPISQAPMATEFAISRFCVPFIHPKDRPQWAVFVDCDVIFLGDVAELLALADPKYAVMVVKHKQESGAETKMDNQIQTFYARKNWSSVVLWNCAHPANQNGLTLEALNTWPGRDLHAFKWLIDSEIGELPLGWNYLVGVSDPTFNMGDIKVLHYTLGGPWIKGWKARAMDELWLQEANH